MRWLLSLALSLFSYYVHAADVGQPFLKKDLTGAWLYEQAYTEFPDGRRVDEFGPHPNGIFVILPNGHYSHIVLNSDMAPVHSGILKELTGDEIYQIASGTLAHYGTFTVDEANGTFTVTIEHSSFPNFDGITQQRTILQLDRDTLRYMNPVSANGKDARVYATLRRAR